MEKAQATIHGQAADLDILLEWFGPDDILLTVKDTSELPEDAKEISKTITATEAAAITGLFLGGDIITKDLLDDLYFIAEPVLKDFPKNLRPIP